MQLSKEQKIGLLCGKATRTHRDGVVPWMWIQHAGCEHSSCAYNVAKKTEADSPAETESSLGRSSRVDVAKLAVCVLLTRLVLTTKQMSESPAIFMEDLPI
jgi:hypothetical protein